MKLPPLHPTSTRYFNNEDVQDYAPKILGFLERNNNDETVTYFQQVRFAEHENWRWHMSSTKIFIGTKKESRFTL